MIPYKDLTQTHRFPLVTVTLILVNIAVFALELFLPEPDATQFLYRYAVVPSEFRLGHNLPISLGPPPFLTTLTALFLHGDFFHLAGNMLYLWIFGDNVEERLGKTRFIVFYLLCGSVATWIQVYASFDSKIPLLGASGAIAGVLAAYLWLYPKGKVAVLVPIFIFLKTVVLPAWLVLGGWILIQVLEVQFSPGKAMGGVAYYAHIGGFAAGLLLFPALRPRQRR